jgi:hypothetical protein
LWILAVNVRGDKSEAALFTAAGTLSVVFGTVANSWLTSWRTDVQDRRKLAWEPATKVLSCLREFRFVGTDVADKVTLLSLEPLRRNARWLRRS